MDIEKLIEKILTEEINKIKNKYLDI